MTRKNPEQPYADALLAQQALLAKTFDYDFISQKVTALAIAKIMRAREMGLTNIDEATVVPDSRGKSHGDFALNLQYGPEARNRSRFIGAISWYPTQEGRLPALGRLLCKAQYRILGFERTIDKLSNALLCDVAASEAHHMRHGHIDAPPAFAALDPSSMSKGPLTYGAILLAGFKGIQNQFDPQLIETRVQQAIKSKLERAALAGITHVQEVDPDPNRSNGQFGMRFRIGKKTSIYGDDRMSIVYPWLPQRDTRLSRFARLIRVAEYKVLGIDPLVEKYSNAMVERIAAIEARAIRLGEIQPASGFVAHAERLQLGADTPEASPAPRSASRL